MLQVSKINIVLPYEETQQKLHIWACEEKKIDFRREHFKATRCTVAFAAVELMAYLQKLSFSVSFGNEMLEEAFHIVLTAEAEDCDSCDFSLLPRAYGLQILGKGRAGVLHGVYEFLERQGIRWLHPDHEVVPKQTQVLWMPERPLHHSPDMPLGRGFDFEGLLKDSTKLWLWMARNKMNVTAYRPYTAAFQKKLGMSFRMGGHIFERILNPDQVVKGDRILWDVHRDWYGKRNGMLPKDKAIALKTQFCMSNGELLAFLSEKLLEYLNGEWYEADKIDLWPFDTWGSSCQCSECEKLGNGTDKTLHFVSYVRKYLDDAIAEGRLDHDVMLAMSAYEGTGTLQPPAGEIPKNLRDGRSYIQYWPIKRCYMHALNDEACNTNRIYKAALEGWKDIPIMVGEYYNVSKFEDLPYLFPSVMIKDFQYYKTLGIKGMTYMHLPMTEWGVRNLTQVLFARLSSDVNSIGEAEIDLYYRDRYGEQAVQVREAYDLIEKASRHAVSWRSWGAECILSGLNNWDGRPPVKPLYQDDHLQGKAIEIGEETVELLNRAIKIMQACKEERIHEYFQETSLVMSHSVNPVEQASQRKDAYLQHYDEDIRLLLYGRDVMRLTVLFLQYYDGLLYGADTEVIWNQIEEITGELTYRYMPFHYINSMDNIELRCEDMMERSQLRELYYRCKRYREEIIYAEK